MQKNLFELVLAVIFSRFTFKHSDSSEFTSIERTTIVSKSTAVKINIMH